MAKRTKWLLAAGTSTMVVALLAILAVPANASRLHEHSGRHQVLLRLSGTVSESLVPDAACGGLHNTPTGTVSSQSMGSMQWQSHHCVDFTAESGAILIRDGQFTLTTCSGTIQGTYRGHAGLPSAAGNVYVSGEFTIAGGTEHFEDATGEGLLVVVANLASPTADLELAGSLSVPPPQCEDSDPA